MISQVAGRFNLLVSRNGQPVRETGWFDNLVLDGGLDLLGGSATWLSTCYIGDGSSLAAVEQAELDNLVATSAAGTVHASLADFGYISVTHKYAITYSGVISEIGIGPQADFLFARALIKNTLGEPAQMTILPGETLTALYEFRIYPPTADVVEATWTSRAYRINAFSATREGWNLPAGAGDYRLSGISDTQALTLVTNSATYTNGPVGVAQAYVPGSYERIVKFSFGLADGNLDDGIKFMVVKLGWGAYQIQFDPAILKTSDKKLDITLKHSWARRA
jgi:hypothetical protein